jgi:hypothetical protein
MGQESAWDIVLRIYNLAAAFWWLGAIVLLGLIFVGRKSIGDFAREFPSRRKSANDRVSDG